MLSVIIWDRCIFFYNGSFGVSIPYPSRRGAVQKPRTGVVGSIGVVGFNLLFQFHGYSHHQTEKYGSWANGKLKLEHSGPFWDDYPLVI